MKGHRKVYAYHFGMYYAMTWAEWCGVVAEAARHNGAYTLQGSWELRGRPATGVQYAGDLPGWTPEQWAASADNPARGLSAYHTVTRGSDSGPRE